MSNPKYPWNDEIDIEFEPRDAAAPIAWTASAADHRGGAIPADKIGLLLPDPDNKGAVVAFAGVAGTMHITIREPGHVTIVSLDVVEPPEIPRNVRIVSRAAEEAKPGPGATPAPVPQP